MRIGMTASGLRRSDDEVFAAAVDAELDGVELVIREDYPNDRFWDQTWRRQFAARAESAGVRIPSVILSTVGRLGREGADDADLRAWLIRRCSGARRARAGRGPHRRTRL
jgi:sugar phosphate isomerase/epimerase